MGNLSRLVDRLLDLGWTAMVAAHAALAVGWWWLMPGGFPLSHPRFWVNRVLPIALLAAMIVARIPWRKPLLASLRPIMLAILPALWIAGSVAALVKFPSTFRILYLIPQSIGVLMALAWIKQFGQAKIARPAILAVTLILAFIVGALFPGVERAQPPGTRGIGGIPPSPKILSRDAKVTRKIGEATISPKSASVQFSSGKMILSIEPLLTFHGRSPDGCWTVFMPSLANTTNPISFQGYTSQPELPPQLYYIGIGSGRAFLSVEPDLTPGRTKIHAATQINTTTWSHLNTFTEMSIAGHKRLFLSFSPCPQIRIEVLPVDYPFGRPARFAFLDAKGLFHVVQASNAEKGPFKDLATGPLELTEPLGITFYDDDQPVYRVEMNDWAMQCSKQLSPTAGWGVPENAIEFSLEGEKPDSAASIFVSLASTSVGRGYDTVGHSPGVYRNDIWVQRFDPLPATPP